MDVCVHLHGILEELHDASFCLFVHVHGCQDTITARGTLEVSSVKQLLLDGWVDIAPDRVGLGEAVLFAGEGFEAIDLFVAARGAHGGVAHAEFHVAVVPRLVVASGVAAEVDFETGAFTFIGRKGPNEPLARLELDRLTREHRRHREVPAPGPVRRRRVVRVPLDLVDVSLGRRRVDDVDDRVAFVEIGDALYVLRHDGGEEDGGCREDLEGAHGDGRCGLELEKTIEGMGGLQREQMIAESDGKGIIFKRRLPDTLNDKKDSN